jgi:hypothetical protein
MIRRHLSALILALVVAAPAPAQVFEIRDASLTWTVHDDGLRVADFTRDLAAALGAYAPNRYDVVERVARQCPGLILRDHDFTDAVASLLHAEDPRWGRNGKRGNAGDPSHDAIAYTTTASPFGVAVIDIIGSAGSPQAAPAWIDQTDATILAKTTGVWIPPSGRLPACLTGGATPPAPDPGSGPPRPAPSVDLTAVVQALERIEARIAALERRPADEPVDLGDLTAFVDDMVGAGPGEGDGPNHVTDLKERADKNRALLEQILAIVERMSRARVFRF